MSIHIAIGPSFNEGNFKVKNKAPGRVHEVTYQHKGPRLHFNPFSPLKLLSKSKFQSKDQGVELVIKADIELIKQNAELAEALKERQQKERKDQESVQGECFRELKFERAQLEQWRQNPSTDDNSVWAMKRDSLPLNNSRPAPSTDPVVVESQSRGDLKVDHQPLLVDKSLTRKLRRVEGVHWRGLFDYVDPVEMNSGFRLMNTSGRLTTEDYSIICMWLSKPSNFSACFGRPPASKENGYALMAAEVNQKSKTGLNISSKQMKERFKTYKDKLCQSQENGEDDQSKGIITISQKLNNLCPCFEQMDVIFGLQPNTTPPSVADTRKNSIETITMVDEHIDENLPNLGESPFDNASYSQNNSFEEREEGIENIPHDSDNGNQELSITSNLSSNMPQESTPTNNTSGKQKASNSLNLNPESHKRGPKSTLARSYAELYKSKVTKLNWEQQKWHLEKEQKDIEQHMKLAIREKEIQFSKDGKDKGLEVKILIANKDCEAMKLKEDNAMLLAVVGSSRSIEEIAEISKILFNR
ncbi:hypothetical protein BY996DRAFT_6495189 [Phakopsora pachyrhizi]|nr:hypothetical protein BY996DRAFT_6495189 [Phakopsora pachyrhizi]